MNYKIIIIAFIILSSCTSRHTIVNNIEELFHENRSEFELIRRAIDADPFIVNLNYDNELRILSSMDTLTFNSKDSYYLNKENDKFDSVVSLMFKLNLGSISGNEVWKFFSFDGKLCGVVLWHRKLESIQKDKNLVKLERNYLDKSKNRWIYNLGDGWYIEKNSYFAM